MFSAATATPATPAIKNPTAEISLDTYVDLLEAGTETERLDLASFSIARLTHPEFGDICVVNGSNGRCAIIYV